MVWPHKNKHPHSTPTVHLCFFPSFFIAKQFSVTMLNLFFTLSWFTVTLANGTWTKVITQNKKHIVSSLLQSSEKHLFCGTMWAKWFLCLVQLFLHSCCIVHKFYEIFNKTEAHIYFACQCSMVAVFGTVKLLSISISICFCPSLLPPVAHQKPRNDSNRDGGEGNESQPQSKHVMSPNTCFGLLIPWEKMHRGCNLAQKCLVFLMNLPQTTIAKCLCRQEEAWEVLFKNMEMCLSYL